MVVVEIVVDCIGPVLRQLDSMALALAAAASAATPKLGVLPVSLEVYFRQTLPTPSDRLTDCLAKDHEGQESKLPTMN